MKKEFTDFISALNISISEEQINQLVLYEKELLAANAVMNLISPKDEEFIQTRHFCDSVSAIPVIRKRVKEGSLMADCGSGAGFPGIPLAVCLPEYKFELVDSIGKRCAFLNNTIEVLKLKNVIAVQKRIGEGQPAETYSAITERAMGHLEVILPQCFRNLKKNGIFMAWQSNLQVSQPRPELNKALKKAKVAQKEIFSYKLPFENTYRHILIFGKM